MPMYISLICTGETSGTILGEILLEEGCQTLLVSDNLTTALSP